MSTRAALRPPRRPRRMPVLTVVIGVVGIALSGFFVYGLVLTPTGAPFSRVRDNRAPDWAQITATSGTSITLDDGREFDLTLRLPTERDVDAAFVDSLDWEAYAAAELQDDDSVQISIYRGWMRCGNGASTWNPFATKQDLYSLEGVFRAEPPPIER